MLDDVELPLRASEPSVSARLPLLCTARRTLCSRLLSNVLKPVWLRGYGIDHLGSSCRSCAYASSRVHMHPPPFGLLLSLLLSLIKVRQVGVAREAQHGRPAATASRAIELDQPHTVSHATCDHAPLRHTLGAHAVGRLE